ncbi:hypothetical protein BDA96_09G094300 [Sorghum bicolor]|uniref:Uncharacterized protein n=2 Tax=Sorghum bicolor TaxID=4558 RepID=A0A921Q8K2_SORBI|nr:hypothetical protein BDA96_09G094300 [Sorghum bicolor]OQU77699.1 hypothetical protein SORBI_3009G089366 [Sorghum bicolor]
MVANAILSCIHPPSSESPTLPPSVSRVRGSSTGAPSTARPSSSGASATAHSRCSKAAWRRAAAHVPAVAARGWSLVAGSTCPTAPPAALRLDPPSMNSAARDPSAASRR